jgi:hypothetical protein
MHKLLYLFAEKLIVSDTPEDPLAGDNLRAALGGLVNSELVCLPRDILTAESAEKIKRLSRPVGLVALSCERELAFFAGTGLNGAGIAARLTGAPRHDMPDAGKGRGILFMPSWRKKLYQGENTACFEFGDSAYCKAICRLLCDEDLFDAADEYGYDFDFAPHEKTYLQLADFDMDETVNTVPPDYPRDALFARASLLITDAMPAYDFAYAGKPVIYYDFAADEGVAEETPHEDIGRFGETAAEHARLVDLIISHMKNDCAAPDAYLQEADAFFHNRDRNNRERIYNILR